MPALAGVFCPSCGSQSLALWRSQGDKLLCDNASCPRPEAAAEILADRQIHHVVTFTGPGFTILHPLIDRLNGLLACDLHRACVSMSGPPGIGTYEAKQRVAEGETDAAWYFEELPEPAAGAGS